MKLIDKLGNKDRIKVILLLLLLYIIYIEIEKQLFESRETNYFSKTSTTKLIQVTDQMFEPKNPNMPYQINNMFIQNEFYYVVGIFKDTLDGKTKLEIIDSRENEDTISIGSIKYPIELKFSKKSCRVITSKIDNNNKYVFFKEDVYYKYRKNKDSTYIVLDNLRNQVTLKQNQIIFK